MGVKAIMTLSFKETAQHFHSKKDESFEPLRFYTTGKKKIILNISGMKFETYESTLERFPNTLLGSRKKRARYYNSVKGEYYFPRDNTAFDFILFFYQSDGMLVKPVEDFIPDDVFRREVIFYELGEAAQEQLPLTYNEEFDLNRAKYESMQNTVQRLRFILERPVKSLHGKILGVWLMFVMALSIAIKCVKTLPIFHQIHPMNYCDINVTFSSPFGLRDDYKYIWLLFELLGSVSFTLEYFARLFTTHSKRRYCFSALGIIDFISFAPHFALLAIEHSSLLTPDTYPLRNLLKFLPFLCIFKVSRYSVGLQIFWKSLHSSSNELGLLLYCVLLSVVLFGSILFYCEDGLNDFTSIPASFWYAIITMTTVGYGDMVATTLFGKLFSACCAVIGVTSLLALPTTVVVNNFNVFYKTRKRERGEYTKQFKDEEDWNIEPNL